MFVLMDLSGNCRWEGKWSGEPVVTSSHSPTHLTISTDLHCTDFRFADLTYQGYSIPFKLEYHFAFLRGLAKYELK